MVLRCLQELVDATLEKMIYVGSGWKLERSSVDVFHYFEKIQVHICRAVPDAGAKRPKTV